MVRVLGIITIYNIFIHFFSLAFRLWRQSRLRCCPETCAVISGQAPHAAPPLAVPGLVQVGVPRAQHPAAGATHAQEGALHEEAAADFAEE